MVQCSNNPPSRWICAECKMCFDKIPKIIKKQLIKFDKDLEGEHVLYYLPEIPFSIMTITDEGKFGVYIIT